MRLGSPVKLIGIQSRTEVNGQHGVLIDMNANGRYYDGAVTKFGGWKGKRFAVV